MFKVNNKDTRTTPLTHIFKGLSLKQKKTMKGEMTPLNRGKNCKMFPRPPAAFGTNQTCSLLHSDLFQYAMIIKYPETDLGLLQQPRWSSL